MTDYKTLRVPEDAWEEAKAQKEENGRTWGEQIVRNDGGESEDDAVVIETVEVSTGESGVTEADVERIVENWIQKNAEDLRRGRI